MNRGRDRLTVPGVGEDVYKGLKHDLDDSRARTEMLGKIASFLAGAGARGN